MEKFNLDSCILFTTNASVKLFQAALSNQLSDLDLTYNMWLTMYFLNKENHISQNQLAAAVGITGPSMVKIIEKLELQGWIRKKTSQLDHRYKQITLTTTGRHKYQQALTKVIEFQNTITKDIKQTDLDMMNAVFNQLTKNARKALEK